MLIYVRAQILLYVLLINISSLDVNKFATINKNNVSNLNNDFL